MAKNVSNNFKNIIKNGGPFYSYAVMTLADGTVIELSSENDFTISGSGYSEDSESGFPLGSALSKAITLSLDNTVTPEPLQDTVSDNILDTQNEEILTEKKSKNYDYYYARIVLYTEADLPDGTTERIQEGIFTVIDSVTPGDVLEINAYDDMYKADVEFVSSLTYPVSAQMLLNEVCSKCDITLGSATFKNNNFQIKQAPEGLTGRQVIGYIAQIAGGNAVIDSTGHLVIKSYDFSAFDVEEDVTAGEVETDSGIHIISEYTSDPDIGTDDITITGVSVTIESEDSDEEDETYIVGSEDYAISVDNPLITWQEKAAIDLIAESIIGITIRPFSGDFMPDPTVEFMDLAYVVDRNDVIYKTFITTHDFNYLGSSTFSCGVESPERHGSSYYSTASEVYQKAKNDIKVNKTQWEQAIENLSQQVANASGLYTTEEKQSDGSTIFYMHNKPTLEESDIVWKMTAETLTVSTDGGKTWNAGIAVNGEVIARIMSTIGINFDWGVGGTLIIQDEEGNQTAYIDAKTGTIRLSVQSLTIAGKTVQEIASEESDNTLNNFVDLVYDPDIKNLQAQIDGQIETWFYSYLPTTSNYPASEWTTNTEKDKHLGDLFYIVDNAEYGGQAYRWAKINNAYMWDYVEDTAVTKALADAAAAKDTADQKRRVFTDTPIPPYDVGDLWAQGEDGDLMRCISARSSGNYSRSDWDLASKYTDDTNLHAFIGGEYAETIKAIEKSVDQKANTWFQPTDPALEWQDAVSSPLQDVSGEDITDTTGDTILTLWEKDKYAHNGDLWKNSDTNIEYIYQDGNWIEMPIPNKVFDEIDGKAQIFIKQPVPPYSVGDLWFNSDTSDIMTCVQDRSDGSYSPADWQKRNKYTDDSSVTDLDKRLDMQGVFNRLTNYGTVQGIYMEDGQIYFLFTYAKGGVLSLGGKNNGNGYAQVLNEDDEVIAELDSNGIGILGKFQVSGKNSYGENAWSILNSSELIFYDSQREMIGYLTCFADNNGVVVSRLVANDAIALNLRNNNQLYKNYILADDNYRLYDQTVKRWHTFFGDERHNGDSYFSKIFLGSDDGNDCYLQYTNYYNSGAISSSGGFYAYGDLGCQGTKHRIVQTDDYQKRLLYSYETPSPYFGDIGCGETDDTGICVIVFDDIFLETVNTRCDYQVFLQKEGPGDIWVESKSFEHFIVRGTPNLKFSWEAKVKQKGYEYQRLEAFELSQDSVEFIDYERQAEAMVEKYYKELEEMFV